MKTTPMFKKAALLGSVGAALVATSAQAQFNAIRGNLYLGLVQSTAGAFDIVVDLGSVSQFTSGTSALLLGGANLSEAYQGIGPATASQDRFANSDVLATFGNLDNLLFSAFGVNATGVGTLSVAADLYVTKARTSLNTQSAPITRTPQASGGALGNILVGVQNSANGFGSDFITSGHGATSTKEPTSGVDSYSTDIPLTPPNFAQTENNTLGGFTGVIRSDLYFAQRGTGDANFLGYFEYQADGDLWFVPQNFVPVPEASTYGLVAGAGLLFMALRRQLGAKTA